MYEIREYNVTDNEEILEKNLSHVWFNVETYRKCLGIIIKRTLGNGKHIHYEKRGYGHHWTSSNNMGLWKAFDKEYELELYNEVGPSMVKKYIIIKY